MNEVIYSPRLKAARCPKDGEWSPSYKTHRWDNGVCLRRHKCPVCGATFKSVQEDPTYSKEQAA